MQTDDPGRAVPEDSVEGRGVPEVRDRRHAAELERKPDGVKHQQGHRERRDVHHHHMTSVFRSGQSGDQERKADLHEQDQEPGDEQPGEVDRHPQVPGLVRQLVDPDLGDRHILARRRQVVVDAALGRRRIRRRLGAPRVPGAAVPKLAHRHQRDEHEQRQREELLAPRHRYPLATRCPPTAASCDVHPEPNSFRCRRNFLPVTTQLPSDGVSRQAASICQHTYSLRWTARGSRTSPCSKTRSKPDANRYPPCRDVTDPPPTHRPPSSPSSTALSWGTSPGAQPRRS